MEKNTPILNRQSPPLYLNSDCSILLLCRNQFAALTHWGRVTHICVGELTIIVSHNGLSPGRRQAIIWTNAGILLIGTLVTHLIQILIGILTFSFTKMSLKVSSGKWRPFCLGLNEPMVNYSISDTTIEVACEVEIRHHGSQLTTYHREFYCVCWWSSEARDLIIIKWYWSNASTNSRL